MVNICSASLIHDAGEAKPCAIMLVVKLPRGLEAHTFNYALSTDWFLSRSSPNIGAQRLSQHHEKNEAEHCYETSVFEVGV